MAEPEESNVNELTTRRIRFGYAWLNALTSDHPALEAEFNKWLADRDRKIAESVRAVFAQHPVNQYGPNIVKGTWQDLETALNRMAEM